MLSSSSRLHFFYFILQQTVPNIYDREKRKCWFTIIRIGKPVIRKVTCINKRPGPWSNEEFRYDCQNVSVYFIKEPFYFIYNYILYLFISFYRYNVINTPLLSVICLCVSEVFCCIYCGTFVLMTQRVRKKKTFFSKTVFKAWLASMTQDEFSFDPNLL